tara:strand:- start:38 stop:271 length:234 start_codon:yes stop_codon:yes gene_type:complete
MIFFPKSKFNLFFNLIFLFSSINIPNLFAHNLFNSDCIDNCHIKVKNNLKKNKSINASDQNQFDRNNSCLNKSLCRG